MTNKQLGRIHQLVNQGRLNEAIRVLESMPVSEWNDWYDELHHLIENRRIPAACMMIERRFSGFPW